MSRNMHKVVDSKAASFVPVQYRNNKYPRVEILNKTDIFKRARKDLPCINYLYFNRPTFHVFQLHPFKFRLEERQFNFN